MEPLQTIEPQTLYSLSQICWSASNWKAALDEIVVKIRPFFIFDNIAVYLSEKTDFNLEVAFAKATGRGKSKEADVAWGENISNEVIREGKTILQLPEGSQEDRLNRPILLGIPLQSKNSKFGVVVFIRFGGPDFSPDHTNFAEFMVHQIASMIVRQEHEKMIEKLEDHIKTLQTQEDFISTLSHELKNPIGFIKGYTTTLLRKDTSWEKDTQFEFLNIIDQETDRLKDLIDNLLDSSKLQSGKANLNFQVLRLDALLNDVISHARMIYPELEIFLDIRQELPNLQGDPRRLKQVFDNLISNTHKYAPGSSIKIRVYKEQSGISVDFRDFGSGIPAEELKKVFDRFYRIEKSINEVHGSGLGLFICKKIIEAHQGQISATSINGKGTTIHIFLPIQ
jgi:signal transduction histidine kinase